MRKTKPKGAKRVLMATAASLAALASLTTAAPKSRAAGGDIPDQRPALGQFDSGVSGSSASPAKETSSVSPAETPPTRGIAPDTPTPPPVDGIRPDTPTPTPSEAILGIQPDTPTPTREPTATPIGIWPDTPTPTQTPTSNEADLNGDGTVDNEDLFLFLREWYKGKADGE
jgi:hypothetical protein